MIPPLQSQSFYRLSSAVAATEILEEKGGQPKLSRMILRADSLHHVGGQSRNCPHHRTTLPLVLPINDDSSTPKPIFLSIIVGGGGN